jgi:hypothetical protein
MEIRLARIGQPHPSSRSALMLKLATARDIRILTCENLTLLFKQFEIALAFRSGLCRLATPLSSSTRETRTGSGTHDVPWVPLLDGCLEPTSRE